MSAWWPTTRAPAATTTSCRDVSNSSVSVQRPTRTLLGTDVVLIGGNNSAAVQSLDLETLVWSRLDVDGPPLAVRGHAARESR